MVVERKDTQFRVIGQGICTGWWEDTPSNRKAVVVFFRSLEDEFGKPLFTHQEVALVVGSSNRQASDEHMQGFWESGGDMGRYLTRKRKVDGEVVEAVESELRRDVWLSMEGLADRVNEQLGREDVTGANVGSALDEVSGRVVRGIYLKVVERGEGHYRESYVIARLLGMALQGVAGKSEGVAWEAGVKESLDRGTEVVGGGGLEGMEDVGDRGDMAQEALLEVSEEVTREGLVRVWEGWLGWMVWAFALYTQGVSLSVIGGWLGVDKSTVCRWLSEVADWGWEWIRSQRVAFSGRMEVDEKWVKIGGVWWYVFAAVDSVSGYPLHVAWYPSTGGLYCKLFLLEIKRLGYVPKVVITDGWKGYIQAMASVFPQAEHLLCRFHVLRSLFRRLRKVGVRDKGVWKRARTLFQTSDKRTVIRRVDRLLALVEGLGVGEALSGWVEKLPKVVGAVGSTWRPSTANGVERFFGAFDRFYRVKGPFRDEASAAKHAQLFLLGYVFRVGAQGQACPLEKAGGKVGQIPFYHLLNRPNVGMLRTRMAWEYRPAA